MGQLSGMILINYRSSETPRPFTPGKCAYLVMSAGVRQFTVISDSALLIQMLRPREKA